MLDECSRLPHGSPRTRSRGPFKGHPLPIGRLRPASPSASTFGFWSGAVAPKKTPRLAGLYADEFNIYACHPATSSSMADTGAVGGRRSGTGSVGDFPLVRPARPGRPQREPTTSDSFDSIRRTHQVDAGADRSGLRERTACPMVRAPRPPRCSLLWKRPAVSASTCRCSSATLEDPRHRPRRVPRLSREMSQAAIIGTGLIGASIGLALNDQGWEVKGWDPSAEAMALAVERGAVAGRRTRHRRRHRSAPISCFSPVPCRPTSRPWPALQPRRWSPM